MNTLVFVFVASSLLTGIAIADQSILSDQILKIKNTNQVPALGALLIQNNKTIDSVAVGLRKLGETTPVTVLDKFHLGSNTKAMTATLAALYIDEGKLSWTSTLGDLFPEIVTMNSEYKLVTVEMLLAHRSGLAGDIEETLWAKLWDVALDPIDGRKLLAQEMLSRAPTTTPGSTFEYSNAGYAIVGRILEKITNTPWETLIQERLFKSLNMTSCGIGPLGDPSLKTPDQPWAHVQTAKGAEPIIADNPETIGPAATVHCSMEDWSKFIRLHMNAYNEKPELLTAESFLKLHTNYPGQEYTYGGWIKTQRTWAKGVVFTHDGSNTLNYATTWWAPNRDLGLIAVSNIGAPSGQNATHEALGTLLKVAK